MLAKGASETSFVLLASASLRVWAYLLNFNCSESRRRCRQSSHDDGQGLSSPTRRPVDSFQCCRQHGGVLHIADAGVEGLCGFQAPSFRPSMILFDASDGRQAVVEWMAQE
ncbi:hypothetical protein B0T18DRAFT_406743 [Schizothecium vesticola]|uniref:Uncharacterized protein n=1 Tax=Schizothecium vesticola TaxID=314040 RepID=A0AA40F1W0_9PEZI|nr:hypothetical protein B0T18DRAFT_406743 [Schizothecium vesticola]